VRRSNLRLSPNNLQSRQQHHRATLEHHHRAMTL
jgi:hypothetical protein